jgi:hypothetical protein
MRRVLALLLLGEAAYIGLFIILFWPWADTMAGWDGRSGAPLEEHLAVITLPAAALALVCLAGWIVWHCESGQALSRIQTVAIAATTSVHAFALAVFISDYSSGAVAVGTSEVIFTLVVAVVCGGLLWHLWLAIQRLWKNSRHA